jgi:hypothetical protein
MKFVLLFKLEIMANSVDFLAVSHLVALMPRIPPTVLAVLPPPSI